MKENQLRQFRYLFQTMARQFDTLLEKCSNYCGVNIMHSSILYEIKNEPGLSLNDLVKRLDLEKSSASRHVQALVKMKFILRKPDSQDRRYVVLTLTKKGADYEERIAKIISDYILQTFQNISEQKLADLSRELQFTIDAMRKSHFPFSKECKTR